ncbi:chaplin [Streptomyces solicavernae]
MAVASAALLIGGAGAAVADPGPGASATGVAVGSPGVLSGNVVQVPVDLGLNLCGNSLNVIALLNPAGGNVCVNG